MPALSESRRFRLKILACMLNARIMSRYSQVILPAYFEQRDEAVVAEALKEFWDAYADIPEEDDLLDLVEREHIDLIHSLYLGVEDWNLDYAADRIIQFAQEQAAKQAVLESLDDIDQGELGTVIQRLKEAVTVGKDLGYTGIDLKADRSLWIREAQLERVPTGMIHLDALMDGGLAEGELGVFLAPPNYGKSMALINCGFGAAGPISRCNVAHFSFEMNDDVVAKRYGARLLFRFPNKRGSAAQYEKEFDHYSRMMLPGDIRIFRVQGTVDVIRFQLDRLLDEGFDLGLIIIDYGDEVWPLRKRDSRYTELGDIFKSLRELGHDYGCPVWTATQANRSSLGKEIITMGDLAESFQKAHVADAIVAICQTKEEEENETGRLFLAKLRDGRARRMVRCKFFTRQQAIITTEFVNEYDDLYN